MSVIVPLAYLAIAAIMAGCLLYILAEMDDQSAESPAGFILILTLAALWPLSLFLGTAFRLASKMRPKTSPKTSPKTQQGGENPDA